MKFLGIINVYVCLLLLSCKEKRNYDINVMFNRVDDVAIGSEVKMNGLVVGKVSKMKLAGDSILVTLFVEKKIKIPIGSRFNISKPLIGPSYIYISPSRSNLFVSRTDTISGSFEENKLIDELTKDSTTKKKVLDAIDKIKEGFDGLIKARKDSIHL